MSVDFVRRDHGKYYASKPRINLDGGRSFPLGAFKLGDDGCLIFDTATAVKIVSYDGAGAVINLNVTRGIGQSKDTLRIRLEADAKNDRNYQVCKVYNDDGGEIPKDWLGAFTEAIKPTEAVEDNYTFDIDWARSKGHIQWDVDAKGEQYITLTDKSLTALQSCKVAIDKAFDRALPVVCAFWTPEAHDGKYYAMVMCGHQGEPVSLAWSVAQPMTQGWVTTGTQSTYVTLPPHFKIGVLVKWFGGVNLADVVSKLDAAGLSFNDEEKVDFNTFVESRWRQGLTIGYGDEDTVSRWDTTTFTEQLWKTDGPDLEFAWEIMFKKIGVTGIPYTSDNPGESVLKRAYTDASGSAWAFRCGDNLPG